MCLYSMYNASYFSFSENSDTDSKGVFVEFETFFFFVFWQTTDASAISQAISKKTAKWDIFITKFVIIIKLYNVQSATAKLIYLFQKNLIVQIMNITYCIEFITTFWFIYIYKILSVSNVG